MVERAHQLVGILHKGDEKLMKTRNYLKSLSYFYRLDYVSMIIQKHVLCIAIEFLLKTVYTAVYYLTTYR